MLRRWLTPWLFALTLLIGQAGALAHAASHVSKPDSGLPDHVCELCLAQANLGSAAASTSILIVIPDAVFHRHLLVADCVLQTRPPVARARAPPAVV
ncbi:MAG: hypothetical protein ABL892_06390 [Thiobacillaceae bacterium]